MWGIVLLAALVFVPPIGTGDTCDNANPENTGGKHQALLLTEIMP